MSLIAFQEAERVFAFLVATSVSVLILSTEISGHSDILALDLKRLTPKRGGVIVNLPFGECMIGGH
jgi:hypothetical protein